MSVWDQRLASDLNAYNSRFVTSTTLSSNTSPPTESWEFSLPSMASHRILDVTFALPVGRTVLCRQAFAAGCFEAVSALCAEKRALLSLSASTQSEKFTCVCFGTERLTLLVHSILVLALSYTGLVTLLCHGSLLRMRCHVIMVIIVRNRCRWYRLLLIANQDDPRVGVVIGVLFDMAAAEARFQPGPAPCVLCLSHWHTQAGCTKPVPLGLGEVKRDLSLCHGTSHIPTMEAFPCAMAQALYHNGACTCSTCANLCHKVGLQGRGVFIKV